MPAVRAMLVAGHVVGEEGNRIQPRWDFLLQAVRLPGVDLMLPGPSWFAARSTRLSREARMALATAFSFSGAALEEVPRDSVWLTGWATGRVLSAQHRTDEERKALCREASEAFRRAGEIDALDELGLSMFGTAIYLQSIGESDQRVQSELRDQAIKVCRKVLEANPKNAQAWLVLGNCFRENGGAEANAERRAAWREEAVGAYRRAWRATRRATPRGITWAFASVSRRMRRRTRSGGRPCARRPRTRVGKPSKPIRLRPSDGTTFLGRSLANGGR